MSYTRHFFSVATEDTASFYNFSVSIFMLMSKQDEQLKNIYKNLKNYVELHFQK